MTSCWGLYARGVLGVLHCSWRHLWQFQNRGSNLTFTEKNWQKWRSRTFTSNHGNIWWPFWWNMCCKPSPKSALLQDVFFSDGQELVLTCNLDSSWDQKLREPGEHLKSFEIIWNHLKFHGGNRVHHLHHLHESLVTTAIYSYCLIPTNQVVEPGVNGRCVCHRAGLGLGGILWNFSKIWWFSLEIRIGKSTFESYMIRDLSSDESSDVPVNSPKKLYGKPPPFFSRDNSLWQFSTANC